MNIFYLSAYPKTCAEDHCDKHVVKMILEYAQLLSTAHRMLDGKEVKVLSNSGKTMTSQWQLDDPREKILYKCAHINHPSNIWVRSAADHYDYLFELWSALNREYTIRYNKVHKTYKKLIMQLNQLPTNIDRDVGFTPPPQCMPDECKKEDTIQAYRDFYMAHKREFATWKTRTPSWFK